MSRDGVPEGLLCRDVVKIGQKKVVVVRAKHADESVGVDWLPLIGRGSLLGGTEGWTSLRKGVHVPKLGIWRGPVASGASGYVESNNGPEGQGGSQMATSTASKRKSAAKKGGRAAAKKTTAKATESKRASNEELDALAEQVVDLRDNQDLSWAEVSEQLDIAPGRLRALYNRGGGEPTRERKGAAKKAAEEKAKASAKAKGKTKRSRKGADPSDED